MKAVRFKGAGLPVAIEEVPTPKAGPGQVVVKIGGAGVCHSDLHILQHGLGPLVNFTLGHENAGWIAECGPGVTGFREGDGVAIYGPWGCGHCHACQCSMENYCENAGTLKGAGGGLGLDGGMAQYMLVPSTRLLVPLDGLEPRHAAPLSDAALTPYHAIKRVLPKLTPDTTVVVLGVGGLGHMAVQLLRVLSSVRIIAGDVDDAKLAQAKKHGADHTVNTRHLESAIDSIKGIVGPRGAVLVLDCVGIQPTIDLGAQVLGRDSHWSIVGLGGGHHDLHAGSAPFGCEICTPFWGGRAELMEVLALARSGRIAADITEYPLDKAPEVYELLEKGRVSGRAVLIP